MSPFDQPRYVSVAVNTMNYTLMYDTLFGGVTAMSKKHFQRVNGYSNQFWGWGGNKISLKFSTNPYLGCFLGEDDDMWNRIANMGFNVTRYPKDIAR